MNKKLVAIRDENAELRDENAELRNENIRLKVSLEQCLDALNAVEYTAWRECLWCGANRAFGQKHKPDCKRQLALGIPAEEA